MMPLPNMTEETQAAKSKQGGGDGTWDTSAGEHNAHADVAFASASLRKAAEYAKILGVDADLRARWLALLARMPTYPVQTLTWVKNASAVVVGSGAQLALLRGPHAHALHRGARWALMLMHAASAAAAAATAGLRGGQC